MVTEMSKFIDKAIISMVSEFPGCKESERIGDLETGNLEAEPSSVGRKQNIQKKTGTFGDNSVSSTKFTVPQIL